MDNLSCSDSLSTGDKITEKKVESKVVLKRYLNGGHPVDMKMAPPWSRFGSTFFFQ